MSFERGGFVCATCPFNQTPIVRNPPHTHTHTAVNYSNQKRRVRMTYYEDNGSLILYIYADEVF